MRTKERPKRISKKTIKKDMLALHVIEKISIDRAEWKKEFI